jgi:hypothetical protein
LGPHQVPDRQADNGDDDQADDERWKAAGRRRPLGRVAQLLDRIAAARLRCIGTGVGHLAARGASDWRLNIAARVDGRVADIPVGRGQDVAAKAVLVKIDNPETIAKLASGIGRFIAGSRRPFALSSRTPIPRLRRRDCSRVRGHL